MYTTQTEEVPDEEATQPLETESVDPSVDKTETDDEKDEEEAIIEDVGEETEPEDFKPPKTKTITKEVWERLNGQSPIWARSVRPFSLVFKLYLSWSLKIVILRSSLMKNTWNSIKPHSRITTIP